MAEHAFKLGKFRGALEHYLKAVQLAPNDPALRFSAGYCAWLAKQRDIALTQLQKAVQLDPRAANSHEALGQLALEMGDIELSLKHSALALELDPDNPHITVSRGWTLEANRQSDAARAVVQPLVNSGFASPRLAVLLSRLAKGREEESATLAMIRRLDRQGPTDWRPDAMALRFASAFLLDRAGQYDEAFQQARLGNNLEQACYSRSAVERGIGEQIAYFTREKLASLARATTLDERPVFIVGMPRSGTSLVEQILASHPGVYGAGELDAIFRLAGEAARRAAPPADRFPVALDQITSADLNELSSRYLQPLVAKAPTASRITDKMPMNFLHLGFISLLFPKARIIHCRRDPRDTCLSCYMTHFAADYEFSYDLSWLGHFYRQYERIMAHWKSVLDIPLLEIEYEQMVADTESKARELVEFLGLPWDPQCLRFYENKRFVGTSSNGQVRRPVYNTSVGRWRHYEKHLGPLLKEL